MTGGVERRTLLQAAGLAVIGIGAGSAAGAAPRGYSAPGLAARTAVARTDVGVSVYAFPLSAVTLLDGPFRANMTRTMSYLTFVDPDRLLHTFRLNAGLPSSAQPCGGWEAPSVELRGHSMGHVLSALAQAYLNTGNSACKSKGDYLVAELAKCQAASPGRGYRAGYLSAFPENFFDRLESGQGVWAPYYTIHKIMAGLLDQYLLAGNSQALTVITSMAAWVKARTDRLSTAQMQAALGNEFGGMPEVLTNLYQVTGNPDHLTTAQRFDHAAVLNPLANNQDQLSGLHANTQIPKIIGAIREYHATGTARYRDIARNFWDIVVGHHTYTIGGNSDNEHFFNPNAIASQLSDKTCECCNTYNMLKLTRQLFFTDPSRADYLDYYERALFNQILGQQDPNSAHGFVAYFLPLRPGTIKTYSNDYDDFTCDHGTGMESNTKYADSIYFYAGETLYVNLFIASVLTWPGRGITVRQDTTYPEQSSTRLTITGSGHIALKLRVPWWTRAGYQVRVNGDVQNITATPGQYLTIDRTWNSGDVVDVAMPAALSFEATPDNPAVQALRYGAIVLAGEYGGNNLSTLPTITASTVTADPATPLHFTAAANTGQVSLIPLYKMHHQRYTVYWTVNGTPPAPRDIAWYKFDETSGTTAADAFGNGKTATLMGTASWTAGRTGNAVALGSSNGYVSVPAGILSAAGDFTIATWIRLNSLDTWARVFDFGTGTSANMFLTPRSSAGTARFAITNAGAGAEQQINGPSALPTGVWTHVAVVLAGSTGILYVNGAEVARNGAISLRPASLGTTSQNYLGRSQYADPYLNGALDSVRIHGQALTASDIANLYTSGG